MRRHIERMPALALNVIEGLSFKGKCYSALAQMLGTRSPPERLAQLLLHLMDLYGVSEDVGTFITAHFTHQDLAHMTGVTRQSVTTTLRRFNDDGTLTWRGPNIVVLSIDKLRAARNGRRDGHTES